MYETIRTVKGHDIKRTKGMKGPYYVTMQNVKMSTGKTIEQVRTFSSAKKAEKFIKTYM